MIEIRGIEKNYGKLRVLDDVSTTIEKGKITSFIGPNGAGKSTLLSVVSRLVNQDRGQVLIEGRSLTDWDSDELAKKVSILRQSNHMNVRLTIRELVSFGRFPHSKGRLTKEDKDFIDRAIEYMKLEDIQHKYLDQLSGGQRQRAYIAMVIAQDTDYILLDEPLNNLDMKHAVEIMRMLKKLVRDLDKTIAIVIHDINFASCSSDRVVAMKDGRLMEEGETDKIINSHSLGQIYDVDFQVTRMNNMNLCVYF